MLSKLPRGSYYQADIELDPALGEALAAWDEHLEEIERQRELAGEDDEEAPEERDGIPTSSAGHTKEVELLCQVVDMLQVINNTNIGMNLPKGKKPPKFRPLPRPVSARQAIKHRRDREAVNEELAKLGIL